MRLVLTYDHKDWKDKYTKQMNDYIIVSLYDIFKVSLITNAKLSVCKIPKSVAKAAFLSDFCLSIYGA